MNSLTSAFGLAKQTAKGTPESTAGNFTWFLATEQTAGAQPRIRQLPVEMGGGMLPRGLVKTGVSGMAALRGVPRPESIGHILLGLAGDVTSEKEDGILVYEVQVETDDGPAEVEIDANTSEVLEVDI